jgi:Xaa-Pro aminopeptidase
VPGTPSSDDEALVRQKQAQAVRYLQDADIDCWMIYVREGSDPITTAIVTGADYVVQSAAFLFLRDGGSVAVLQPIDVQNKAGLFLDRVVSAGDDIDGVIAKTLHDLGPRTIAVNYSRTEFAADGLTHGMYLRLQDLLATIGFQDRVVSADGLVVALRAVKVPEEVERLRRAAEITDLAAREVVAIARAGVTQRDIAGFLASRAAHYGAERISANVAANSRGENDKGLRVRPLQGGDVVVSDMGAIYRGYCADLKRCWYVLDEGEIQPPALLEREWDVCRATLEQSLRELRAGRSGWEVHEAAWTFMERQGFVRDRHSYGHQIGRREHDAGPWLGDKADIHRPAGGRLEPNMVVTLDPTINRVGQSNPGAYSVGMEEMGIVGRERGELLYPAQADLFLLRL